MHTAEEWPSVVDRMNRRMRMMHDIKVPTDNEPRTLAAYLQRHAQKPMDKTKYTDLDYTRRQVLRSHVFAVSCLADPKQHSR